MDLILNDLSIHQQFHDLTLFRQAIHRLMGLRQIALGFRRDLYCHRGTVNRLINPTTSVFQGLQSFSREQKLALLVWLGRQGPFWEDALEHDPNEVFECQDDIVTDTGVGEAAYRNTIGMDCRMVSLVPSVWDYAPIVVKWLADSTTEIQVHNYWDSPELEAALKLAESPIETWEQLETASRLRFDRLVFVSDSFHDLYGRPFAPGAAQRILTRLETLNRLMCEVDESGHWTPEGQRLYENHFTGERARFSDSSETEKHTFRQKLTFRDPDGNPLFCPWHGKVNHPPFRIHFSWPILPGGRLYIVYLGWKITVH